MSSSFSLSSSLSSSPLFSLSSPSSSLLSSSFSPLISSLVGNDRPNLNCFFGRPSLEPKNTQFSEISERTSEIPFTFVHYVSFSCEIMGDVSEENLRRWIHQREKSVKSLSIKISNSFMGVKGEDVISFRLTLPYKGKKNEKSYRQHLELVKEGGILMELSGETIGNIHFVRVLSSECD